MYGMDTFSPIGGSLKSKMGYQGHHIFQGPNSQKSVKKGHQL
jgi:hypothetical protein